MEIVLLLKDLGFNFWQVVVVLLVFMFRLEIRQILERIKTLEVLGNKIGLTEDAEALVKAIRVINDEATKPGASIQGWAAEESPTSTKSSTVLSLI